MKNSPISEFCFRAEARFVEPMHSYIRLHDDLFYSFRFGSTSPPSSSRNLCWPGPAVWKYRLSRKLPRWIAGAWSPNLRLLWPSQFISSIAPGVGS